MALGSSVGSGAQVAVRQAKELGETADEATELYLEAFFSRYDLGRSLGFERS